MADTDKSGFHQDKNPTIIIYIPPIHQNFETYFFQFFVYVIYPNSKKTGYETKINGYEPNHVTLMDNQRCTNPISTQTKNLTQQFLTTFLKSGHTITTLQYIGTYHKGYATVLPNQLAIYVLISNTISKLSIQTIESNTQNSVLMIANDTKTLGNRLLKKEKYDTLWA